MSKKLWLTKRKTVEVADFLENKDGKCCKILNKSH